MREQLADLKPRHDDLLSQKVDLTSGIADMSRSLSDAQAEVSELRSQLAASSQHQQMAYQDRADSVIRELQKQLALVRSQLEDQANKAEQWYSKAKDLEQQIERLQQRQSPFSSPPIPQGELPDNTPESQALQSEPLESSPLVSPPIPQGEPLENIAIAVNPLDIAAPTTPDNEPVGEAAPAPSQGQNFEPLTSKKLGKRLGVDNATISRHKKPGNEHFREWSAALDPDGIAWEYREGDYHGSNFHPLV